MVAVLRLHGARDGVLRQQERGLVERLDRLAAGNRELAALVLRARVLRVLLGELREVRAVLDLRVQLVGERLLRDEDVADVAALRRAVLRLVLVVVVLDLLVGDLHVLGDLLEDPLLDELRADVAANLLVGEALLLELLLVALLVAGEVLLLDLLEPVLDLLVADVDVELVGLLLELRALHEELDGLVLEHVVLGGPDLREGALLGLVALLRLADQPVELGLRDRVAVDDGDRVAWHALVVVTAAATCDGKRGEHEQEKKSKSDVLHGKTASGNSFRPRSY